MFSSTIELNDSEILKLEAGPVAFAKSKQGQTLDIDRFTKDLAEQCNACGFTVEVKVFDTNQGGTYGFEIEINGRTGSVFDPDRQVHEVVNNILAIPGQGGWLKSEEAAKKLFAKENNPKHRKH